MPHPPDPVPLRTLTTYGRSRAVRLADYDYTGDADIHITICAEPGITLCSVPSAEPMEASEFAKLICGSVEFCSKKLHYRLYGFTLMPDHLHILFSPADSRVPLKDWLRDFKSFTTNQYMRRIGASSQPPRAKQPTRAKPQTTVSPPIGAAAMKSGLLWQRSAHDHVCRTEETAEKVLTYIVNNPVRAGLVKCWQDWPWTHVFIEL